MIPHSCKRQLFKHLIEKWVCDQNTNVAGVFSFCTFDSGKISFRKRYGTQLVPRTKVPVCNWTVSSDAVAGSTLLKITGFDTPARCFTMRSKSHASPPSADRRTFTLFFLEVRGRISDCSDFNNPALTWRPKRTVGMRINEARAPARACMCVCACVWESRGMM